MTINKIEVVLKSLVPVSMRPLAKRLLRRRTSKPGPDLQQHIDTALRFRARGVGHVGEAKLARVLNRGLPASSGLSEGYISEFIRSVEARRSWVDTPDDSADGFLQQTRRLETSILPCTRWLLLSHACIRNGLFKAGGVARDKAVRSAYQEASPDSANTDSLARAFKAAIDQADFERAQVLLTRLEANGASKTIDHLKHYYYLNKGDREEAWNIGKDEIREQDLGFAEYIDGKSVAFVGPAPSKENVAHEIDSFDVVIRFNYRGRGTLPNAEEFGRKLDVSYYNGQDARSIDQVKDHRFFDDLDYAVFKFLHYPYQERLIESQRARVRPLTLNTLFFTGSAYALQEALYDLLHFHPRKIKVFHANFFLDRRPYYAGYRPEQNDQVPVRWRTFANQEILSGLNLTRNLWKAGLVEADNDCEAVLRLTPEEYLVSMEEIY